MYNDKCLHRTHLHNTINSAIQACNTGFPTLHPVSVPTRNNAHTTKR